MPDYVVEFAGCGEACIRTGDTAVEVSFPDDLGCAPTRVRRLDAVKLRGDAWEKNGVLRCTVETK